MNHPMTLREARAARGLSQARLARLVGTTQKYVSKMELGITGNPRHHTVQRLEKALKLKPGTLAMGAAPADLASWRPPSEHEAIWKEVDTLGAACVRCKSEKELLRIRNSFWQRCHRKKVKPVTSRDGLSLALSVA